MIIRKARQDDRHGLWSAHTRAIREVCSTRYAPAEIEAWAGRLEPDRYAAVIEYHEVFVAADRDEILGFGELDPATGEVRALYVHPSALRRGVGSALLRRLEKAAVEHGRFETYLAASLNSVSFYTGAGYAIEREGKLRLSSDVEIACVFMRKKHGPSPGR